MSRLGSNPAIYKESPPEEIPGATRLVLVVFNDLHPEGQIFALSLGSFKLGSAKTCEIQIEDALVAPLHGIVSVSDQGCVFMDTSPGGTTINNRRTQNRDEALQLTSVMKMGNSKVVSFFISDHVSNMPWKNF